MASVRSRRGVAEPRARFFSHANRNRLRSALASWILLVGATVGAVGAVAGLAVETQARTETVRWTHPSASSVDGFRIFVRQEGQGYQFPSFDGFPAPVGGVFETDFEVDDAADVFFVATAYDQVEESVFSNEIARFAPFCGDGDLDAGESCDDGNNANGDGCDASCGVESSPGGGGASVGGELATWHEVDIRFSGPVHAESDSNPNPFLDYRLQCLLTGPSGQTYDVPGFFDGDGASGTTGDVWRCRFAPDEAGLWTYRASFRDGPGVAVSLDPQAGSPLSFDGTTGTFAVQPSTKTGDDFRSSSRGRLVNAGDHFLTFLGSGERWIKGGTNVPENLLGYQGFDNTPNAGHSFSAHTGDWRSGDPDWGSGAGRGLIGALNYIADTGGNSVYFLPMNIGGDGDDTFPTIAAQDKIHYDTSKLRQWETVFRHATSHGIFLHFQLSETERANEQYHDGGQLGPERMLFYRELVARFGHHPGLQWDLGEENDYGTTLRRSFAAHLKALDPYDHPVTTHTRTNALDSTYAPLLGNGDFDQTGFQVNASGFDNGAAVEEWRNRSAQSGVPWMVSIDEPQGIQNDPNDTTRGYPFGRTKFLWPTYMSGGGGFEWYVQEDGGGHSFDQRIDDFREMQEALRWTRYAREFLGELPFWLMEPRPAMGSSSAGGKTFVLARPGDAYALYHPQGGSLSLDLGADTGSFAVRWFDPKTGEWFAGGIVQAGGQTPLGIAPFGGDAAVLLERTGGTPAGADPVASFTATPLQGQAPLAVSFDAASSVDDGMITAYDWSFGDGEEASGVTAQHSYADPGSYVATLVVIDDEGRSDASSQTIVVLDPTPPGPGPGPGSGHPGQILFSEFANRNQAQPLESAQVSGEIYVFLPAVPSAEIASVHFYLDDPGRTGPATQVERVAPYDMGGGSVARARNPLDTEGLSFGSHRIDVDCVLDDGSVVSIAASFTVEASGGTSSDPGGEQDPTPIPEPLSSQGGGAALLALLVWAGLRRRR